MIHTRIFLVVAFIAAATGVLLLVLFNQVSTQQYVTQIQVYYAGEWSGTVKNAKSGLSDFEGTGNKFIDISCESGMFYSASIQKTTDSDNVMNIRIVIDGEMKNEDSTVEQYGTVSLTGVCF